MIILDEKAYAESLIKNGSQSLYPKVKDVTFLAKYYYYIGLSTSEVKLKLKEYCFKTDKNFNMVVNGWKIKSAINTAKRYRLKTIFPIMVTKAEVETIKQWKDYNYQKILFVLIVMAKFSKYSNTRIKSTVKTKAINNFYANETAIDIFKMARIFVRKNKRYDMFYKFHIAGILDFTRHDSFKIKCIVENSEPEIVVTDFDNLVLHWQRFCGEPVAGCKCGRLFLRRSNRHSMCRQCWKEHRKEKVKIAVMKYYYKNTNHLEKVKESGI